MNKKNIRQRREYLFQRQSELTNKKIYEKKERLKKIIEEGQEIPSDLKKEADELLEQIQFDDMNTAIPNSLIDNEYYNNRISNPKILVTTSRSPSQRLIQFLKEIRLIIPNCVRINRGNIVLKTLVSLCQSNDFSDLILLHQNRGVPDGIIISHMPQGPTIYFGLYHVVLRHDIKEEIDKVSEANPHLIFDGFNSRLGERITEIIKNLFPVPKLDSKRILTFYNNKDYISFRHHVYEKNEKNDISLEEVGPRFELRPYQILLGTVDQPDSTKEWVLRPFMNTAKNKNNL